MKLSHVIAGALLAVGLMLAGLALADEYKDLPGYMDLEWITIPANASEVQDIDLGPILVGLAADAEKNGDDALVKAIAMIKSVRVKAFSIDDDSSAEVEETVKRVQKKMEEGDWKRMIYMKDEGEIVSVNTKYAGKDLVGLMILTYEPGDSAAFVNVAGDLDLGTMLKLAKEFDSDSIEDMLEELDGIDGIEIDHDDK
jgi:hypothetical protein